MLTKSEDNDERTGERMGACRGFVYTILLAAWASGLAVFGDGGGFFAPPIWTEDFAPSVFKIYSYAYRKYQKSKNPW